MGERLMNLQLPNKTTANRGGGVIGAEGTIMNIFS